MDSHQLVATTPMGLESLLAAEITQLGATPHTENGRVTFSGDNLLLARANLWLRTADRVFIQVAQFPAPDGDSLFEGVRMIPWERWIPVDGAFPVEARLHNSRLTSLPVTQAAVKKAIATRLSWAYKTRELWERGPVFQVEISIQKDMATLTLDTSGEALHKRGYRTRAVDAPLKETLAAAMVMISRWNPTRTLLDPCCGSGTLLIEAALIGQDRAPGLGRSFQAEQWPWISPRVWAEARTEAHDRITATPFNLVGSDHDPRAISLTEQALRRAELGPGFRLQRCEAQDAKLTDRYGILITNPPYGERLGDEEEVLILYKELGDIYEAAEDASAFVITSHPHFERAFGWNADRRRKLYNGRIPCQLYQYLGPLPPRPRRENPEEVSPHAE